jgi:hypothetical protein
MEENENENFILILSDIGKNSEEFEYSLRIIKAVIEIPPSGLSKEYWKFENIFSEKEVNQLTDHSLIYYIIDIGDATFPYKLIYKLSENELKILKKYLDENLEKIYIQHSINPAGAPILFILKKDGSLRLCVDYRDFNKITIKNRYSLPLIKEILNRLNGAAVYTKFDLKEAYYRIRIKKKTNGKRSLK